MKILNSIRRTFAKFNVEQKFVVLPWGVSTMSGEYVLLLSSFSERIHFF
ncbi:MAG TPA: hypothetical protein QF720_00745 [Nitrospinota bacterium]|nr:hypothetical protein [Nitrospinota bacterium]